MASNYSMDDEIILDGNFTKDSTFAVGDLSHISTRLKQHVSESKVAASSTTVLDNQSPISSDMEIESATSKTSQDTVTSQPSETSTVSATSKPSEVSNGSQSSSHSSKASEEILSTKPSSVKSVKEKKIVFRPCEVKIHTINSTAVSLLSSSEPDLVKKMMLAMYVYIVAGPPDSLDHLHRLDPVDDLVRNLTHPVEAVRQHSMQILAALCEFPDTVQRLRGYQGLVDHLCQVMIEHNSEIEFYEFASDILAHLIDKNVTLKMLETQLPSILISRVTELDPDIQKNCLLLMINILNHPLGGDAICNLNFRLCPIIKLFSSEYQIIQRLALRAFEFMTKRIQDPIFMSQFVKEKALETLLMILEQIQWPDLYHLAMCCIKNYCKSTANAQNFLDYGAFHRLLRFIDLIDVPEIIECGLDIMITISQLEGGRTICIKAKVPELLLYHLRRENVKASEMACVGLLNMIVDDYIFELVINENVVRDILCMLSQDFRPKELHHFITSALYHMMVKSKRVADQIYKVHGQVEFYHLLRPKQVLTPVKTIFMALYCIQAMSHYEDIRQKMPEADLTESLLCLLHTRAKDRFPLRRLTFKCLNLFMNELVVADWFLAGKGVEMVLDSLTEINTSIRLEALAIITLAATDETLVTALIHGGVLDKLLAEKHMRENCPAWENAVQLLFESNLSAKFAYLGRLEIKDITKDNFYLTEKIEEKFPVLEQLLTVGASTARLVFIANFRKPPPPPPTKPRYKPNLPARGECYQASAPVKESPTMMSLCMFHPNSVDESNSNDLSSDESLTSLSVSQYDDTLMWSLPSNNSLNEENVLWSSMSLASLMNRDDARQKCSPRASINSQSLVQEDRSLWSRMSNNSTSLIREKTLQWSRESFDSMTLSRDIRDLWRSSGRNASISEPIPITTGPTDDTLTTDELTYNSDQQSTDYYAIPKPKCRPYLPEYQLYYYVEELNTIIDVPEVEYWYLSKTMNIHEMIKNAQLLAVFVANHMNGSENDAEQECTSHMHELHLQELKEAVGLNIIPLGHVRIGLHVERAMLYKVLADRICLPCALQRGQDGRLWVEVVVPKATPGTNILEEPYRLLRPKYIMNLMDNVGAFIPLDSPQAKQYCTMTCLYDYPPKYRKTL